MSFILLIVGFALLIKSADILIDNATKLAFTMAIPTFIIGFTVVAIGTSAPELVVGIISGIRQENLLTLGNIIGSGILNISLTVGLLGLIYTLQIQKDILYVDIPICFAAQVITTGLLLMDGALSRIDALILFIMLAGYLVFMFGRMKGQETVLPSEGTVLPSEGTVLPNGQGDRDHAANDPMQVINIDMSTIELDSDVLRKKQSKLKLLGLILVSLIGVAVGGHLIVNSSSDIAKHCF